MTRDNFIKKYAGGYFGDNLSMEQKLYAMIGFVFDYCPKYKGTATVDELTALEGPDNLDVYRLTGAGNLNPDGDVLAVIVGDLVYYDTDAALWKLFVSAAAINV